MSYTSTFMFDSPFYLRKLRKVVSKTKKMVQSNGKYPKKLTSLSMLYPRLLQKKETSAAGFEPTRAEPSRFLVYRLNHSAKRTMFYP